MQARSQVPRPLVTISGLVGCILPPRSHAHSPTRKLGGQRQWCFRWHITGNSWKQLTGQQTSTAGVHTALESWRIWKSPAFSHAIASFARAISPFHPIAQALDLAPRPTRNRVKGSAKEGVSRQQGLAWDLTPLWTGVSSLPLAWRFWEQPFEAYVSELLPEVQLYRLFPAALSHLDLHKTGSLESGKEDKPAWGKGFRPPCWRRHAPCLLPPLLTPLSQAKTRATRAPRSGKVSGSPCRALLCAIVGVSLRQYLLTSDHKGDSEDLALGPAKLGRRERCSLGPQAGQIRKGTGTPR